MKTITLKADSQFDITLTNLAKKTHSTKSAVIRAAVLSYKKQLEKEALRLQIKEASFKTRGQAKQASADLDSATADGL